MGHAAESEVHRLNGKQDIKNHSRLSLLLAMTGIMIMLSGCGQEEPVIDEVQVQTEQTADTADGDNTTTETAEGTVVQKSIEPQQKNTADDQLEIDEDTRQQLMTELLEENEMDMSVAESGRTTNGCTFDLPEGFEESMDVDGLYVTVRYPIDTSMIYYEVMDGDISLQLMTEELFREQAEDGFRQTYGEEVEVTIDSYEIVKIGGYPAFRILCHYEVEGIRITQLEYVINADKTYVITYSQTSDYDWMEAFEASAATISVK